MRMSVLAGCLAIWAFGMSVRAEEKKAEKLDPAKLVGEWKITEGTKHGEKVDAKSIEGKITFTKDTITIKSPDGMVYAMSYTLDMKAAPAAVDMKGIEGPVKDMEALGILGMEGESLKLCYSLKKGDRPKAFESKKDSEDLLFVLKKEKK